MFNFYFANIFNGEPYVSVRKAYPLYIRASNYDVVMTECSNIDMFYLKLIVKINL